VALGPFSLLTNGGFRFAQIEQARKTARALSHLHLYVERCGEWAGSAELWASSPSGAPVPAAAYGVSSVMLIHGFCCLAGGKLASGWDCKLRFRTTTRRNGRLGLTTDNVSTAHVTCCDSAESFTTWACSLPDGLATHGACISLIWCLLLPDLLFCSTTTAPAARRSVHTGRS
jgi:hypothetical protein